MDDFIGGVYEILNITNGHKYIGSTIKFNKREKEHWQSLTRGNHHNLHLQRAYNKYGRCAFEFRILMTCHPTMCIWYEQQFLDQWQPEYNHCLTAGNTLGRKHSKETKAKMSKSHMGIVFSDEHRTKMSLARRGIKRSEETKAKIAASHRGTKLSDETRSKISKARMGFKHSKETRAKISAALKGNTHLLGHKHSEETKVKMSKAKKGKPWSLARRAAYNNRRSE